MFRRFAAFSAALLMAQGAASAASVTATGSVTAGETIPVFSSMEASIKSVNAHVGDTVEAGQALYAAQTTAVYATEAGTVRGVFAAAVTESIGAVLYLEGETAYTVSASTSSAYSSVESKRVVTGETLYLISRSDTDRTGTGVVTAVDGTSYTVKVTEGSFLPSESVSLYRDADHTATLRVGRGSVSAKSPTAVSGSGIITSIAVADGQTVQRGDLLFETVTGTGIANGMVTAPVSGTVASLSASVGDSVSQNALVATLYPSGSAQVTFSIPEDDLAAFPVGAQVTVSPDGDASRAYPATVTRVAAVGTTSDSGSVTFEAVAAFAEATDLRFGQTVNVEAQEE